MEVTVTATYPVNSDYCANCNTIGYHRTVQCPTTFPTPGKYCAPLPPAAVYADEWQPSGYRVFEGEQREIPQDRSDEPIAVWTFGYQNADGRIRNHAEFDLPLGISVSGVIWENALSAETARHLADLLVTAAEAGSEVAR